MVSHAPCIAMASFAPRVRAQGAIPRLTVQSRVLEVNGKAAKVFGIVNSGGGIGHSLLATDRFQVEVANELSEETLLHWHGLTPPSGQDGVPHLSQPALKPGERFSYDFQSRRAGTHWMHSHVGLQEQQLLAAPLIIRETRDPLFDQLEHVVMLHDFTFRPPAEILAELQGGGGEHAGHSMQGMDHSKTDPAKMAEGGGMGGMGGMLNDVVFDAYLANDRTLADPEVVRVERGMSVRLRIINACAASNMWIDLGELDGEVIAVDGISVVPHKVKQAPLAIAQRLDIRVRIPAEGETWPVMFLPEGVTMRTGFILAAAGAAISRVAEQGELAPPLDLEMEARLNTAAAFPEEPVTRTEMVMLTGGDQGYVWGLNGKPSMHDTLFTVREGERVDIMMHNMTAMAHPMHLHGHYFKVVAIDGVAINGAVRDTVLVPPGRAVTVRFDADNPGNWAFHCHHLYHMNSGMMAAIRYSSAA
jgi:FtsP/CotA-like multicopper oxidase with cupredoxin domain